MESSGSSENILKQYGSLPPRFQVIEVLGKGASGIVLKVNDMQLERQIALKILDLTQEMNQLQAERFAREAKLLVQLDHPNIMKIYFSGLTDLNHPFHAMELLQGLNLSERIANGQVLPTEQFFKIFCQVSDGLKYIHEKGIIHRDIKPSNLMICPDQNKSPQPKLIDFGVSRPNDFDSSLETITALGSLIGTPSYMSPEQCKGERAQSKSDIYSLGCVMYQCLTGAPPFSADSSLEMMQKHLHELPLSLKSTSGDTKLSELIMSCLEKNPENRPTAKDLQKRLKSLEQEFSGTLGRFRLPLQKNKQNRALITTILFLLVIAASIWPASSRLNINQNPNSILESNSKDHFRKKLASLQETVDHIQSRFEHARSLEQKREQAKLLCTRIVDLQDLASKFKDKINDSEYTQMGEGNWQKIIASTKCLDKIDADYLNASAFERLAQMYRETCMYEKGVNCCDTALQFTSENHSELLKGRIMALRIDLLLKSRSFDRAEQAIKEALKYWRKTEEVPFDFSEISTTLQQMNGKKRDTLANDRVMDVICDLDYGHFSDQERLRVLSMTNTLVDSALKYKCLSSHKAVDKALAILASIPIQTSGYQTIACKTYSLAQALALQENDSVKLKTYKHLQEQLKR